MRKHIILASLLGLCLLSLTACQRGENQPPVPHDGTTADQATPPAQAPEPTASNNSAEPQQPVADNTPELAATNNQNNLMPNQGSDNAQPTPAGNASSSMPGTPGSNSMAPADQSGTMQNNMPSTPSDQNTNKGNEVPPGSDTTTPSTDNNMDTSSPK